MLTVTANARSILSMWPVAFFVIVFLTDSDSLAIAGEKTYKGTVLEQLELDTLSEDKRVLKMTLLEMQPGAEIPAHTHKGPGLRYVLEGAVAIAWKDRGMQTFEAGSTYFENAGENHPSEEMSAKNMAEGITRVLIVELLPLE